RVVAMYAPNEPVLDYNMVIIFLMAVGTVATGGYWAGSRDRKKRYMKHKRDDGAEKQDEETVDVTPIMICVFVVMCCNMLVLLYFFYDHLGMIHIFYINKGTQRELAKRLKSIAIESHWCTCCCCWKVHFLVFTSSYELPCLPLLLISSCSAIWVIGIFCVASSVGLYSCLWPFVRRLPFCKCRIPENNLPYLHKRPQIRTMLLSALCISISIVWMVFRNEDQWAWVLQDALGIAFCLYMLKTVRLPTFKVSIGDSPPPTDSVVHLREEPNTDSDICVFSCPWCSKCRGLLVAYCHRFDILTQSSRIYFVACTIAYGIGLLITFVALAVMQMGQPALLYLVPCTLLTSLAVALWRRELRQFWTGSGFVSEDTPDAQPPQEAPKSPGESEEKTNN
ncbi:hypothetical protein XENOCAPTIV_015193, partial [Xenoophorus captivus]